MCLYPFCLNLFILIACDRVTQESSGFDEHLVSDLFPSHDNTVSIPSLSFPKPLFLLPLSALIVWCLPPWVQLVWLQVDVDVFDGNKNILKELGGRW